MKIREIFNRVDNFKPSEWGNEQKLEWLNTLEGEIYHEIVLTHENPDGIKFEGYTDDTATVIAPDRFCDMYIHYLVSLVDFHNGDLTRYSNDSAMFAEAQQRFANWYNRTHMPIQQNNITY